MFLYQAAASKESLILLFSCLFSIANLAVVQSQSYHFCNLGILKLVK